MAVESFTNISNFRKMPIIIKIKYIEIETKPEIPDRPISIILLSILNVFITTHIFVFYLNDDFFFHQFLLLKLAVQLKTINKQ